MKTPALRTMRRFAEEELVIPDGPFAGQRFRADRQPFAGPWLDECDSGIYKRKAATGPTQTGKTLLCAILPVLYHLFERKEKVIFGVPTMDVAVDKWNEDLLPAILAGRYAEELPSKGLGSKGGKIVRIRFKNGATLRFMTGRGGDESRSGYTAPVVVITEADKMDEAGGGSREADPITQLERRTDAYLKDGTNRVYLECTVSVEHGRIWQEYSNGTASRIVIRCPHCRHYVTPEREHLAGWRDAADVIEAGEKGALCCPDCGVAWSEEERVAANLDCKLLHRGQEISRAGTITGAPARTDTLGFRWTATNNLLAPISSVAQEEWKAIRAADEDNAEKGLVQFRWALPFKPKELDAGELDYQAILRRTTPDPKGRVPSDAEFLVVAIDVHKFALRWICLAMRSDRTPHVVEYGVHEVPSAAMEEPRALGLALREFNDRVIRAGWSSDAGPVYPEMVLVDEGYLAPVVRAFCREAGGLAAGYAPAKGFGVTQYLKQNAAYHHPRKVSETVAHLGDQYHLARLPGLAGGGDAGQRGGQGGRIRLFDVNADHWKGKVHAGLKTPAGRAGGITLHAPSAGGDGRPNVNDHLTIAKHWCSEKPVEKFDPVHGRVIVWVVVHRNNHLLDAGALALVAADYVMSKGKRHRPAPAAPAESSSSTSSPAAASAAAAPTSPGSSWFGARRKR